MDLENYKPQHRDRMYYANWCNYCFSLENLMKCASCRAVSYCSKEHQMEDWEFHKPTCIIFTYMEREIMRFEKCSVEAFSRLRNNAVNWLTLYRNLPDKKFLTEYERQICLLPWVCTLCYRKPSLAYMCVHCQSVIYCSSRHKEFDSIQHLEYCSDLKYCRLFASVGYENGFRVGVIPNTYHPIKKNIRQWPTEKLELGSLIQNELKVFCTNESYAGVSIFMDPYLPAATIITALEIAGLLKKRQLMTKSAIAKRKQDKKLFYKAKGNSGTSKTTLTIHFAKADDYEMSFQWNKVAQLLTDWIINIDEIEVLLIGPTLSKCTIQPYELGDKLAKVFIYEGVYQDVDCLSTPDIIVLFECTRPFIFHEKLWNIKYMNALFKYSKVPIIFTSGDRFCIDRISDAVIALQGVETLVDISLNNFTDMRIRREWPMDQIIPYKRNSFFCVHRKV